MRNKCCGLLSMLIFFLINLLSCKNAHDHTLFDIAKTYKAIDILITVEEESVIDATNTISNSH